MLAQARDAGRWRADFAVVLTPEKPLSLETAGEIEAARATIAAYAAAGATALNLRFVHHSLAHYLECLERFAAEFISPRGGRSETEA
jgi:hypothetical protein